MPQSYYTVYILLCRDGSYYTGMTSELAARFAAHQQGLIPKAYTRSRRPVVLVWSEEFGTHDEAFHAERRIKGWSRAKKRALIRGDLDELHEIVRREWEQEIARRNPTPDKDARRLAVVRFRERS